jgi:class 3 adenylate cyclase/predicted ATPase
MLEGLRKAGWEAPPPVDAAPDLTATPHHEAERRQVTAMSCELISVAGRADGTDLEDRREAVGVFRNCVSELVRRHGGFIVSHLGNTALILFGYPAAHEDDAEEAVRAGLELCTVVRALRPGVDVTIRCRVGIATGMVIVGDATGAGQERHHEIVGDTPDLAARLQISAQPDQVVVGPVTRRLVGNLFDCHELDTIETSGGAKSIPRWQVAGETAVESRFEALRGSALSPLIGREEEVDLLLRRWARAKTGNGQVVLISGEPGIGKSRVVAALTERIEAEPYLRLRYFCSPHHQDSALSPSVDQLGRAAGFARDESAAAKLQKLEALLARADPPDEDVALIADLMSLRNSGRHPLPNLSPQRKKERTLEALVRQLEGLARRQPVMVVFEDAHWIDPTSRELLDLTIERLRTLPVLLIVTFRPEFQPPWTDQPQVTTLALNRLDRRDRTILIEQIAGGKALPVGVVAQIVDRTDGVPLFVEELTKNVLESGLLREEADCYVLDGASPALAIPTTLHASLMARLDRLQWARRVAQIGAAVGRDFSYQLVHAVSRLPEGELEASLGRLVSSELVSQRGAPPDAVYAFKHALVRDAAHGTLLRGARQELHTQIAKALETQSPELMDNQPELFAQHYAEAGLVEKSVACWGKAGRRSAARSAMVEAAAQFQKGLDQLALLPDTAERQRQDLEFLSALGAVLQSVKGFAAPETGHAYVRARQVWEQLGSPSEFLQVPLGQSFYHTYRSEFDLALRLDKDLLRLSRQRNDAGGLVLGHFSSGRTRMLTGSLASSRSHLEQVLTLYDPDSHALLLRQTGTYPHVNSLALLGNVLFCLGFPDQALARCSAAIAEARRLTHQPSLAASLNIGTRTLSLIGDNAALEERAKELVALAAEQGFSQWQAFGRIYRGWVEVKRGDLIKGISLLRSGLVAYRATGAEQWMPYHTSLLAAACETAGQTEEALAHLHDASQMAERTGERWYAAELNRRKGELLLWQGDSETAEELYRNALSIAQKQQAKLWELRAAVNLARLRRDQGRRSEGCNLLAPVYRWFTEGFNTPDLKQAKALLDELG